MRMRWWWRIVLVVWSALIGCGGGGGGGDGGSRSAAGSPMQGAVQKGPFAQGSVVDVYGLDAELKRGPRLATTTVDEAGGYSVNVVFSGPVQITVRGSFFDEITGIVATGDLKLLAIADLSASRVVNVNVLSDLQFERVRDLVRQGTTLESALETAKKEVLSAFHLDPSGAPGRATELDLFGQGGATLLELSYHVLQMAHNRIVAGNATDPGDIAWETAQVLNEFGLELASVGSVEDATLQTELEDGARKLDPGLVEQNLSTWANQVGQAAAVPDIRPLIDKNWDGIPDASDPRSARSVYTTANVITSPAVNDADEIVWVESGGAAWRIMKMDAKGGVSELYKSGSAVESVALNNAGEIVRSELVGGHYQIFSSKRGQMTSGDADNYTPSVNDSGEIVWATQTCDTKGCTPMQLFSLKAGSVDPGKTERYRPSVNNRGEIVWDEYDGQAWRIVSSKQGPLKTFDSGCVQGTEPAINDAGALVWTEVDTCGAPPFERRLLSSLSDAVVFSDFGSLPAGALNNSGTVVFAAREGSAYVIYRAILH